MAHRQIEHTSPAFTAKINALEKKRSNDLAEPSLECMAILSESLAQASCEYVRIPSEDPAESRSQNVAIVKKRLDSDSLTVCLADLRQ